MLPKSWLPSHLKGYIPVGIASYLFDVVDKDNLKIIVPKGPVRFIRLIQVFRYKRLISLSLMRGVAPSNDLKITYQSKNVSFDGPESVKYGEDVKCNRSKQRWNAASV